MQKIDRARRTEISRGAQHIRQHGQVAGWSVDRIAAAISDEFPEVTPLEARRLAYGWTRAQVIDSIVALYVADGLAAPGLNSSMLCRWEHGELLPSQQYVDALCHIYQVDPKQLRLATPTSLSSEPESAANQSWRCYPLTKEPQEIDGVATLAAVRESINLALEVEGLEGGPCTREQLRQAIDCYALNYSAFPPRVLASEVHHCRILVADMLKRTQTAPARNDLRRVAGWQSALLGNIAFHLADCPAAHIHLATAARLGTSVTDSRLICWSLGAQSMVACHQRRFDAALNLARQGLEHATSPLARAQILTWAELPALAHLGSQHRSEAMQVLTAARREMDAASDSERPGRFGFDVAEFELHAAEALLVLGNASESAAHAQASLDETTIGRPSWAAATLALAAADVRHKRPDQAVVLAMTVLDTIRPESLRATSRQRLIALENILSSSTRTDPAVRDLHERLRTLPVLSGQAVLT